MKSCVDNLLERRLVGLLERRICHFSDEHSRHAVQRRAFIPLDTSQCRGWVVEFGRED